MIVTFRIRRDTAANWAAVNPILALGEPGLETDTRRVKYGDGVRAWVDLGYSTAAPISFGDLTTHPTTLAGYGITDAQPQDNDLAALAANSVNGLWARTGDGTGAARTLLGTAGQITVTNGSGAGGNPTFSLANPLLLTNATYAGNISYLASVGDAIQRLRIGHYDSGSVAFPTGQVAAQILAGVTQLDIGTRDNAAAIINFRVGTAVAVKAALSSSAFNLSAGVVYQVAGSQVVGARKTGWTLPTGTVDRSTFATYTAPTISNPPTQAEVQAIANHVQVLSRHLMALLTDLHATAGHGLIGA